MLDVPLTEVVKSCVIVIPGCGPVLDIDDPGLGEEMTEMLLDTVGDFSRRPSWRAETVLAHI